MFLAGPPVLFFLFFFASFANVKVWSFRKIEVWSSMGGVAPVDYSRHNAVLTLFGRRRVCVGLPKNKPLLQWFAVMKEQVTQGRILCLVVRKLH